MSQVAAALESAGISVVERRWPQAWSESTRIRGVRADSREVRPGDLFVAWAGGVHDAHDYLAQAVEGGAVAAVVERPLPGARLPHLRVDNARRAAAVLSDLVQGSPWAGLRTAAVTGTNGKTTTALILRGLLDRSAPATTIGTLGIVGPGSGEGQPGAATLTTPGCVEISMALARMVADGVRSVVIESSSHALAQHRLDGVRFDVAAYTNLSQDHLDYHGTIESYLSAKARLLKLGKENFTAVINAEDDAWCALEVPARVIRYGCGRDADLRAVNLRLSSRESRFDMVWRGAAAPVTLPLVGRFNVVNALCASACALALGESLEAVAAGLARTAPIPGRLEPVTRDPCDVFVDFAHTPDALKQMLRALRPLVVGRIIVVFGAGGDRDRSKRPDMGAVASRLADVAVITSDNPRTEDPLAIIADVKAGAEGPNVRTIVDRREAIHWALDHARPGDAVVLAGKGHETRQVVSAGAVHFDERKIVQDHLRARA